MGDRKIGDYSVGPKMESGAFGIDTILVKNQNGNFIKYFEGRLLKLKTNSSQSIRQRTKARQILFNEMKIMDELRAGLEISIFDQTFHF